MEFELDSDTLNDLEIFSKRSGDDGIWALFKNTRTIGARDLLNKIMREPLWDPQTLANRLEIIKYFRDHDVALDFNYNQVDLVEHYLKLNKRLLRSNPLDAFYDHLSNKISVKPAYYIVREGVTNIIRLFRVAKHVIDNAKEQDVVPNALLNKNCPMLLKDEFLIQIAGHKRKLNCFELNKLDRYLRKTKVEEVRQLLTFIYQLDVYESAALVARKSGWGLPVFTKDFDEVSLKGLFHPNIQNPVLNDIKIDGNQHLIFLTGSNMAGKSSFLKSVGLAVYLAHLGFPVPAKSMQLPIFKGMVTTVNLSDNIGNGLSHYYSEIKRIKYTALKILEKGRLFVIIDELFRGTNPKDAFDASLLIMQALSKIPNCVFMISTHHTELAEEIGKNAKVSFKYLESKFDGDKPEFSFKLKDGVSHSRSGMYILKNEGVLDILDEAVVRPYSPHS